MKNNPLHLIVFFLGLAVTAWVGIGLASSHPWALALILLIAAVYVAGWLELRRYRQATASLHAALDDLPEAPASLEAWLERVDPSLRNAVRLRVEGERVALPAPVLPGYLSGLLVLLGMLGTLLGMMATLRGTGIALETATDLQAIRDSLAAPVKGLGFAFGTSIAGIATSAMLGLLAALCRRDRVDVARLLDARISGALHVFTPAHRREEMVELLRRQAEVMPALVERLEMMATGIERQSEAASERQSASQEAFHARTEAVYVQLAASVERSLRDSVQQGSDAASRALQPIMQATMDEISRGTAALHAGVGEAVQQHLQGVSGGLQAATGEIAETWSRALDGHRQASEASMHGLRASLEQLDERFGQRSSGLLDSVSERMETTVAAIASGWNEALSRQQATGEALASENREALSKAAATFEQHAAALVLSVERSQRESQAALAEQDGQRLAAWTGSLESLGAALREEWSRAGEIAARQQQDVCATLERTAGEIVEQSRAHAGDTIAEISRLMQTASEAPRAAAEVIAELRQSLSESMARDTAMLQERTQLLATLETLLDAVNHASTEQKAAIDALVGTSAELLEGVGSRFAARIEAETGKLGGMTTQLGAGAVEVASLGEAFGVAAQAFGEANGKLVERLERIEGVLEKSLVRSDEQLAYYVAQAREVVDLSLLAQKQIIADLRRQSGMDEAA